MKSVTLFLLLAIAAPAISCDIVGGAGASVRYSEGKSGGLASVACVFHDKWELRGYYFGEQLIYGEMVRIDGFAAISASKLWMFRDGRRIRPILGFGVLLKGAQRCHYNGDLNCNRVLPLPFCFMSTAGIKLGDVQFTLNHCSNDSMDYGPEKKNLGEDFLRAEVWF